MTDTPAAELSQLLEQLVTHPAPDRPPPSADSTESAEPLFSNVDHFVRDYLVHVVERRISEGAVSGVNWCARWWAHPEALSRIYALWRAWETLRVADPATGMSTWWRDHLDPHLNTLTGEYGPFVRCTPDRHTDPKPLPVVPAPPEVLAQLPDRSDASSCSERRYSRSGDP